MSRILCCLHFCCINHNIHELSLCCIVGTKFKLFLDLHITCNDTRWNRHWGCKHQREVQQLYGGIMLHSVLHWAKPLYGQICVWPHVPCYQPTYLDRTGLWSHCTRGAPTLSAFLSRNVFQFKILLAMFVNFYLHLFRTKRMWRYSLLFRCGRGAAN